MNVKIKKYIYRKMADIYIYTYGIICNVENIMRLMDILKLKNVVTCVDTVERTSLIFSKTNDLGLKHKVFPKLNPLYVDAMVMSSLDDLRYVFNDFIHYDVEALSFIGISDENLWEKHFTHNRYEGRKLVKDKISEMYITVSFDEDLITLFLRKEKYDVKKIIPQIQDCFSN